MAVILPVFSSCARVRPINRVRNHDESVLNSDTYTIFEGTSEIQRLIVARAISGVQIK
jgi:alkylation response protein AidB-like acyl-CoA dehydrogenase